MENVLSLPVLYKYTQFMLEDIHFLYNLRSSENLAFTCLASMTELQCWKHKCHLEQSSEAYPFGFSQKRMQMLNHSYI